MIRQAIASDDPVVFFEPKRRYHVKGEVDDALDLSAAPAMGSARVVRPGSDVTLVTFGGLVQTALDAAAAAEDEGTSIEVIDLRSLSPVDYDTVAASVRSTGRQPSWAAFAKDSSGVRGAAASAETESAAGAWFGCDRGATGGVPAAGIGGAESTAGTSGSTGRGAGTGSVRA